MPNSTNWSGTNPSLNGITMASTTAIMADTVYTLDDINYNQTGYPMMAYTAQTINSTSWADGN